MGSFCGSEHKELQSFEVFNKRTKQLRFVELCDDVFQNTDSNLVFTKIISSVNLAEVESEIKADSGKFTDEDFPPSQESIGDAHLDYQPGWQRIPDCIKNAKFMVGDISPEDILQGNLGDCYLLSAVAALAERPHRIKRLFVDTKEHHDTGIYFVRVSYMGMIYFTEVDDYVPVNKNKTPAFVQPHGQEYWPLIIEKAWAKINEGYGKIIGGFPHEVLNGLTPASTYYYRVCNPKTKSEERRMAKIWNLVCEGEKKNWCFCTGTTSDKSIQKYGLVVGHAYTLLGGYEVKSSSGKVERLVKLRNPWGQKEWNGRCSDKDSGFWKGISSSDKKLMGFQEEAKDDGLFFMSWEDYLQYYDMIDICRINDDYHYNFEAVSMEGSRTFFVQLLTKKQTHCFLGVHQEYNREKLSDLRRVTMIAASYQGKSPQWLGGVMEGNYADTTLEVVLPPGRTVVYCKVDWPTKEDNYCNFSCYGETLVKIKVLGKEMFPDFLNKAFTDYVMKAEGKQLLGSKDDWVFIKMLYEEAGFGVIMASAKNCSISVSGREEDFMENGFKLRKPLRGKGAFQLVARKGESLLILARSDRDYKDKRIRFPPQSLKIQKIK